MGATNCGANFIYGLTVGQGQTSRLLATVVNFVDGASMTTEAFRGQIFGRVKGKRVMRCQKILRLKETDGFKGEKGESTILRKSRIATLLLIIKIGETLIVL